MGGPFFIPDLFSGDWAEPNFDAIASHPNVIGCILKATQGTHLKAAWFQKHWSRARALSRYGTSWFRGVYHFAETYSTGTAQADYLLDAVESAGGWGDGDMPPIWDIEDTKTMKWSKQQSHDVSAEFAARIYARLGRRPVLYGNGDEGIEPEDGFAWMWTPHLTRNKRWTDVRLWQYAGDDGYYNPSSLAAKLKFPLLMPNYPLKPKNRSEDMNVVMENGQFVTSLARARTLLTGQSGMNLSGGAIVGLALLGTAAIGAAIYAGRHAAARGEGDVIPRARLLK